nr:AI-2E family transporter [Wolbachia endosymbiont of Atemnus politus]
MQKRHVTGCLILIIIGTLFLVRPMIFPCLMSIVVAYLFNPLVVKLEKYKIPPIYSVIFLIFILLMVFVFAITFVSPIIYVQITSILNFLISKVPSLNFIVIQSVLEFLNIKVGDDLFDHISKNLAENHGDHISYVLLILPVIL